MIALAELIVKDLAQGGQGQIDLEATDRISASLGSGRDRMCFHFALARYLDLHGQREAANRYAKRCMGWTTINAPYRTLSGAMLVEHGVKPVEYMPSLERNPSKGKAP